MGAAEEMQREGLRIPLDEPATGMVWRLTCALDTLGVVLAEQQDKAWGRSSIELEVGEGRAQPRPHEVAVMALEELWHPGIAATVIATTRAADGTALASFRVNALSYDGAMRDALLRLALFPTLDLPGFKEVYGDGVPGICRRCACTDRAACDDGGQGCSWIQENLCSACAEPSELLP